MQGMLCVPKIVSASTCSAGLGVANDASFIRAGDPAVAAMTDFLRKLPDTIEAHDSAESALREMARHGVRALLVTRADGEDADGELDEVIGLITYDDIEDNLGRRPQAIGSLGVIAGTIVSYLAVLVVPQTLIVRSLWRKELTPDTASRTFGQHPAPSIPLRKTYQPQRHRDTEVSAV